MQYRPSGFNVLPPVVKNLLIINGLFFLATIVLGQRSIDLTDYLALHHWYSGKFKIWQIITHMFMHGNVGNPMYANYEQGFMHIFSNMFALWMFGSVIENTLGSKRFLTFYLLCGIGAAFLHLGVLTYQFNIAHDYLTEFVNNPTYKQFSLYLTQNDYSPQSQLGSQLFELKSRWAESPQNPSFANEATIGLQSIYNAQINEGSVGASGAVFGLLFAFGFLFPNTLIYIYFLIPLKAKYFVALYALFELYAGVQNSAGDNIAHFAHLGGMLVAFIILKIWNKKNRTHFY
ncbi:MAG: rhomboid family intramembrane serine protease [Chitinophagaceae bacterium]